MLLSQSWPSLSRATMRNETLGFLSSPAISQNRCDEDSSFWMHFLPGRRTLARKIPFNMPQTSRLKWCSFCSGVPKGSRNEPRSVQRPTGGDRPN